MNIAALAGLVYTAIAAYIYFSQRRMLYRPRRQLIATPNDRGLAYEDVRITTASGNTLHGWWLPQESPGLTLLFSHGNGGNVSHRLESLRLFHDLGLSVLIYDYSGYGQSTGRPSEKDTREDARAAWQWLTHDRGINPAHIILFGRSLGGAVAAELADYLGRSNIMPAGMILESTFTSVPDIGALRYPWLPVRTLARFHYDTEKVLQNVILPILFLHSREDEIIPFALGRRLFEGYNGQKSFLELLGDHNTGFLLTGQVYTDGLNRFLSGLAHPARETQCPRPG